MREDKTSVETKAESGAALGVPPGRSNFARKNAPCRDTIPTREMCITSMYQKNSKQHPFKDEVLSLYNRIVYFTV